MMILLFIVLFETTELRSIYLQVGTRHASAFPLMRRAIPLRVV